MAKKTTYKQTIRGNKAIADSHKRSAKLLGQLAYNRRVGLKQLGNQYKNALKRNKETRQSVVADLIAGQQSAIAGYDRSEKDAKSNLGEVTSSSMLNRAREGANAMSELSNMQAGETDRIKGMAASIRNMKTNLDAGASDYASAITSINNSLGDLNTNVTTNINNALREQNTSDAQAFAEYLTGRQQGYSDLVDLYGQQGAAQEQAADNLASKTSKTTSTGTKNIKSTQTNSTSYGKMGKKWIKSAEHAFDASADASAQLAKLQGEKFTTPITTIAQMNAEITDPNLRFAEAEMKKNQSNLDNLNNAGTLRKLAAPQGSRLRKAAV